MSTADPEEAPGVAARPAPPEGRSWWFWLTIGVLVCLFFVAVHHRDRIRAHWWASQLASADDTETQAYYLGLLVAVGDSAEGAVKRLARHECAEVRALAVVVLARLPDDGGFDELRRLLWDTDRDVAESAALSLAFMDGGRGLGALIEATAFDQTPSHNLPCRRCPAHDETPAGRRCHSLGTGSRPTAAAAAGVAALSRIKSAEAVKALCNAAARHPHPLVRAQAVESLAACIAADQTTSPPCHRVEWLPPASRPALGPGASQPAADRQPARAAADGDPIPAGADCDPIGVLVAALSDQAEFHGELSLERQIRAAMAAVGPNAREWAAAAPAGTAAPVVRTVSQIAADHLGRLTGMQFDHHVARTAAEQAELAVRCRYELARRAAGDKQQKPESDGVHSSDTSRSGG
ncbi:MAG: HEAT repeat domain-containing protein [Phycisphaerae bacterium]|nr:HEAT repeat domain-containing protein [Phycisphaerae bacterium]